MILQRILGLFYIVSPTNTIFKEVNDVPDFVGAAMKDIAVMFCLEICLSKLLKKNSVRTTDTVANLIQYILSEFTRLIFPAVSLTAYKYLYANWRLVDLPWDSLWTWWISFFTMDCLYYFVHRASHEINFLWGMHHVHHSSEDYNIAVNLRQSLLQPPLVWVLYIPLALVMPTTTFLVHAEFNYIYQFWIHTELIGSLGPLEYILNTPSHHRVHHARNKECIDKNFAGTLIIWDRLFGTFEPETNKQLAYGTTEPMNTFQFLNIQFTHYAHMWKMFWTYEKIGDKLSVIFKGPGWAPGKPRLGKIEEVPEVKYPVKKHEQDLPTWKKLYIIWHFLLLFQLHLNIMLVNHALPAFLLFGSIFYTIVSLLSIGILMDNNKRSSWIECFRCLLFFGINLCFLRYSRISLTILHSKWIPQIMIDVSIAFSLFLWLFIYFKRVCMYIFESFKDQKFANSYKVHIRFKQSENERNEHLDKYNCI